MTIPDPSRHPIFGADDDPADLSIGEAQRRILAAMSAPAGVEWVALRASLGRVLAQDLYSPVDVPAHRSSAMDGYALRLADRPEAMGKDAWQLPVLGVSAAGRPWPQTLPAGAAIRILTGAVVPEQADAVVMQERVERVGDAIRLAAQAIPAAGANIRAIGEDLRAGACALRAGRRLRPADLGLAASLGLAEIPVRPRLRVAFFSTGDELCSIGRPPMPGQVYDSNRYTLFGMLTRLDVDLHDLGVVGDSPEALEAAFQRAVACADVVLSSGGVSVGDADFVRPMLARLGHTVFWKIALKPGRPFAYGRLGDDSHFFGLPGNPVAVMVTFHQIVRPALLRLMGVDPLPEPLRLQARTLAPLRKAPGRFEFQRGVVTRAPDGSWQVAPTGEQGSGMLSSMSLANCFICLPEAVATIATGSLVEVEPFDEGL
jgi:molybdopterin molybdotransferase